MHRHFQGNTQCQSLCINIRKVPSLEHADLNHQSVQLVRVPWVWTQTAQPILHFGEHQLYRVELRAVRLRLLFIGIGVAFFWKIAKKESIQRIQ